MKKLFKKIRQLAHEEHWGVVAFCAATMFLVASAVFISSGGMSRVNDILATYGITPDSQTGCVFHCNYTSYTLIGLWNLQDNVAPGTPVTWVWNAGGYGANNFSTACDGLYGGNNYKCTLNAGSPDYSLGCVTGACLEFDAEGICTNYRDAVNCGNIGENIGDGLNYYGPSGGTVVSSPGYHGGTITIPAPAQTTTYYFCSQKLLHWDPASGALGCQATTLTVATPCTVSAAGVPSGNATSYYVNSGGVGSITVSSIRYCVRNYTGTNLYIPTKTAAEWNTFKSAADAARINVGINTY